MAVACKVTVWPSSSVTVAVIDLLPVEAYVWLPLTLNAPLEVWLTVPDDELLSPQLIVAAKSAAFACPPAASLKLPTTAVIALVAVAVRLLFASAVRAASAIAGVSAAPLLALLPPSSVSVMVTEYGFVAGMFAS